ncbi:MAG: ankyrin repeat domain-containing protein, partial [Novosphingobium sp.]|nr:ankyrin repeat domain-containing protein [Novosphingobium sp.]
FKQFDNKKDINYIITNISKLLKDKGSSNYQANTNKLKKILDKGYYFRPDFLEIKKLILSGSDVNIQNKNSFTALMIASCNDHKEIVKLLITAGADVNIQDKYNNAALIKALDNDYVDIAKLLIAAGTNINAINNRGSTALMWAVVRRHKEIVKLLIAAGADVNIQNESGNTALIEFIRFHDYNIEIAKLLIDAGADVNIKNTNGYTVLSLATVYNHSGMLELLREVTAK